MARSDDLRRQAEEKAKEAKKYGAQIEKLQPIREEIASNLDDEAGNVNKQIRTLTDDLKKAIKHSTKFSSAVQDIENGTEATGYSDPYRNPAYNSLDAEIRELSRKKDDAERESQRLYAESEKARQQEEQERREREEQARRDLQESLNKFTNLFR